LPFAQARELVSHGATALLRFGFPDVSEPQFSRLRGRFLDLYRDRVAIETRLYDGLAGALDRLDAKGIAWGIVTNKPRRFTEPLLENLALLVRARAVVSGDTLAERKPHPAPLLYAAGAMRVAPSACLYIGDAEGDVLAARAANMRAAVALFGYIPVTESPFEWPAHEWLETPAALVALLDSLAGEESEKEAT
jgi:phosphoglycolate phosphatase